MLLQLNGISKISPITKTAFYWIQSNKRNNCLNYSVTMKPRISHSWFLLLWNPKTSCYWICWMFTTWQFHCVHVPLFIVKMLGNTTLYSRQSRVTTRNVLCWFTLMVHNVAGNVQFNVSRFRGLNCLKVQLCRCGYTMLRLSGILSNLPNIQFLSN